MRRVLALWIVCRSPNRVWRHCCCCCWCNVNVIDSIASAGAPVDAALRCIHCPPPLACTTTTNGLSVILSCSVEWMEQTTSWHSNFPCYRCHVAPSENKPLGMIIPTSSSTSSSSSSSSSLLLLLLLLSVEVDDDVPVWHSEDEEKSMSLVHMLMYSYQSQADPDHHVQGDQPLLSV